METNLRISHGQKVAISYRLTVEGRVEDETTAEQPLEFIFGYNQLLPAFEAQLEGATAGQSFEFTLSPREGYGEFDERNRFWIPRDLFLIEGEFPSDVVVAGATIPMMLQGGGRVQGTVVELNDTKVYMDFNHPLAGKSLHFTGNVEWVRTPSVDEIEALEAQRAGHGCGCSCGGHSHCDHEHGDHEGCCGGHGGEHDDYRCDGGCAGC